MNRTKLKAYAPKARREFINAVTDRAAYYGLTKGRIETINEKGDVAIIAGKAFPRAIVAKRKRLEERIGQQGFDQVMEAMAYTWFNRFAAIRFIELHGYLDHGYRVLSHPEGKTTPEIVEHAEHVDLPGLDREKVIELKIEGTREAELYGMLLIAQCNALNKAMPFLFEKIDDETELLLPENLLHSDSLIRKLVNEIPEEEWKDIEIIGWLYQFYISEKKDQVIGKVVKSEDIPAATQLFTPNWIVKYMVQNTLGRQWMATYPDSPLKQQMEYYIEPAEQTPEVLEQLKAITPTNLNPEELTFLDPATGSGHILVEAYDLFKAIYQERGYRAKDIPRLILEKNLFGLEIDDRAAQLATFALMMKARADDRRIFDTNVQPHVLAIQESKGLDAQKITEAINTPILKTKLPPSEMLFEEIEEAKASLFSRKSLSIKGEISQEDVAHLIALFEHGKTFGSLIRVTKELAEKLPEIAERVKDVLVYGDMHGQAAARLLMPFVEQARLLASNHDAVVANPPYMGSKGMNSRLKSFAQDNYPDSKSDLFAMFIERGFGLTKENGYNAMVTMQSWMFLSSYEKLRESLIKEVTIDCLVHMANMVMGIAFGTAATVWNKIYMPDFRGHFSYVYYEDLTVDNKPKQFPMQNERLTYASAADFKKIPGSPIAYWASHVLAEAFRVHPPISDSGETRIGLITGENSRYIRFWHEVSISGVGFGLSRTDAAATDKRWFPQSKGGNYRKWYGNNETLVDWYQDGSVLQSRLHESGERILAHNFNLDKIFQLAITWTKISSGALSARLQPFGFLFNDASANLFIEDVEKRLMALAFLNSIPCLQFLRALNPTLNFLPGNVSSLPFPQYFRDERDQRIPEICDAAVCLARTDWDNFETSWDFFDLPLLRVEFKKVTLEQSWEAWAAYCRKNITEMQLLETENNRLWIDFYDLQDELIPEVPESEITLARPEQNKDVASFLSYAIGILMGRYSLDKPGLIYAHCGNEGFDPGQYRTFPADEDGIIPLTELAWFEEDAANRVVEFIGVAWPKEHLEENLTFVAESLGQNQGESPREMIRRYLATGFFKHHLSMYKRRPIYWLFSSGKLRAFQCLVYLHRYNEGTLSRMRTDYVIPLQGKMSARIDQLIEDINAPTSTSHQKKLAKEKDKLVKQLAELRTFDEKLRHYADLRICLDLDDGVKVNYGKFGDLLAEVKAVTGSDE